MGGRVPTNLLIEKVCRYLIGTIQKTRRMQSAAAPLGGLQVFVATAANNEKVVIKKLISDEDHEKRNLDFT